MSSGAVPVFGERQFERLEALLDDPALEGAMRLDEIQAYLCAALAGPRPIDENERLADILDGSTARLSVAGSEAAALIGEFTASLAADMAAGRAPELLLYPKDESEDALADYPAWCEAYLLGVDQAAEEWFEQLDDEEANYLDERLFPLMVLTSEAESAAKKYGEIWPEGEELAALEQECANDLAQAVTDIYRFWIAKRGLGTIRREAPKAGRNDPCPCNSGRKFKQCCGRGE